MGFTKSKHRRLDNRLKSASFSHFDLPSVSFLGYLYCFLLKLEISPEKKVWGVVVRLKIIN